MARRLPYALPRTAGGDFGISTPCSRARRSHAHSASLNVLAAGESCGATMVDVLRLPCRSCRGTWQYLRRMGLAENTREQVRALPAGRRRERGAPAPSIASVSASSAFPRSIVSAGKSTSAGGARLECAALRAHLDIHANPPALDAVLADIATDRAAGATHHQATRVGYLEFAQ